MHFDDYSKEEARLEPETRVLAPMSKEWEEMVRKDASETLGSLGIAP
jgi:hypothetical protein